MSRMTDRGISIWQGWSNELPRLELNDDRVQSETGGDIVGRLISGQVENFEFHHNFQRCSFRTATLSNNKLRNVDFKDCAIVESTFVGCDIAAGSTVSCTYTNCIFVGCLLFDAAFHECVYIDCRFVECDFRSSMIRNSRIEGCEFVDCLTSNKLFDGCLIFDSSFVGTLLDFRAIIDNFALDAGQINENNIRLDRSYPKTMLYDFAKSPGVYSQGDLNPFEALRLNFFLAGGTLRGGSTVDKAFEAEAWMPMVRAPINFMRLLQDFAGFILHLYDGDSIPIQFVVKLSILAETVWSAFGASRGNDQLVQVAAGVHLQCLQRLEVLQSALTTMNVEPDALSIAYRSFDDASDDAIFRLANDIAAVLPDATFFIRPRNSPVDIVFTVGNSATMLIAIYVFLNTKTRVQLIRKTETADTGAGVEPFFNFEAGGGGPQLQSILNFSGNIPKVFAFRIEINFSSGLIENVKRIVKDVRTEK